MEDERSNGGRDQRVVSSCFGGGGFFAMAFATGVADGMEEAGLPVRNGPMLGTSGGAWAAGAIALELPLELVVEAATVGKSSGVAHHEITRAVFGEQRDERVSTVAIERRTGRPRLLRAEHVGVADAVGASSAAPGLFPPYPIGTVRYVDGGLYSPTSAHRAAAAQVLVVVAPLAGPIVRPMTTLYGQLARNEARLWRLRSGGDVIFVEPTGDIADAAGGGWRSLLDPATTNAVYERSRVLGRERAGRFLATRPRLLAA